MGAVDFGVYIVWGAANGEWRERPASEGEGGQVSEWWACFGCYRHRGIELVGEVKVDRLAGSDSLNMAICCSCWR